MGNEVNMLIFDNVRPARLSLDELLSGRVAVQLLGAADDVPALLSSVPAIGGTNGSPTAGPIT